MKSTSHHVNAAEVILNIATGYTMDGLTNLQRAPYLDWTIKTGNGSLYSTVEDLAEFDRVFYTEKLMTKATKEKMFG